MPASRLRTWVDAARRMSDTGWREVQGQLSRGDPGPLERSPRETSSEPPSEFPPGEPWTGGPETPPSVRRARRAAPGGATVPGQSPLQSMLRRLPVDDAVQTGTVGSRRGLPPLFRQRDLVVLGLGVMIGAGVFKTAGVQASTVAGPGVVVSYVIAGVACLLAALCYAELSSALPVSGSAYTFTYVIFGELLAWLIGWALMLELLLGGAVVARTWSLFATNMLGDLGFQLPPLLVVIVGQPHGFDLFALLVLVPTVVLVALGGRLGVRVLWGLVGVKVTVILLVILLGLTRLDLGNLAPLVPPAQSRPLDPDHQTVLQLLTGEPAAFGLGGLFVAAANVALAYVGFDVIATAAEETENERVDVARGMVVSLLITVALYLGVALIVVGMVSFTQLDANAPLVSAFEGVGLGFMGPVIGLGSLVSLSTVMLVLLIGATRVTFSMARDNLLPPLLSEVSRRYRTPTVAAFAAGTATVVLAQVLDARTLEQVVVAGALFAFAFVAAEVLNLRLSGRDLHPGFRAPGGVAVPLGALGSTFWLMLNLELRTWGWVLGWTLIGLVIYLGYGRRRSRLGRRLAGTGVRSGNPVDRGRHRHDFHYPGLRTPPRGLSVDHAAAPAGHPEPSVDLVELRREEGPGGQLERAVRVGPAAAERPGHDPGPVDEPADERVGEPIGEPAAGEPEPVGEEAGPVAGEPEPVGEEVGEEPEVDEGRAVGSVPGPLPRQQSASPYEPADAASVPPPAPRPAAADEPGPAPEVGWVATPHGGGLELDRVVPAEAMDSAETEPPEPLPEEPGAEESGAEESGVGESVGPRLPAQAAPGPSGQRPPGEPPEEPRAKGAEDAPVEPERRWWSL
jgi:basic amino acid/polyamine antiporter, APA family